MGISVGKPIGDGHERWLAVLILLMLAGIVQAQVTTGTILGSVSDSTGAVVPGTMITMKHIETGITRDITADAAGHYRVQQLAVGEYELTAKAEVEMWLRRPAHRKNLLRAAWREVGLGGVRAVAPPGVYQGLDVTILTADFGVR